MDRVRLVYAHLVADSGITFKINIMQNKIPTSQKYRTTVPENAREGVYCSHINNEANFFQHFCSLGIKSKQRPIYQKNNSHTLLYKTSSVLWEIIHFQLNGHQITTTFLKIMYFFSVSHVGYVSHIQPMFVVVESEQSVFLKMLPLANFEFLLFFFWSYSVQHVQKSVGTGFHIIKVEPTLARVAYFSSIKQSIFGIMGHIYVHSVP